MPIFNFMFQMALRRFIRQIRRLLNGRKWSNSLSTGLLVYCFTAQFLHRPLPRGNASHVLTCIQSILAARYFYAYGVAPECKTTPQRQNF
jgi:hypothetical protein